MSRDHSITSGVPLYSSHKLDGAELRRKSEQVIFRLEQSACEIILKSVSQIDELPSSILDPIILRIPDSETITLERALQETFFQEVVDLLPHALKGEGRSYALEFKKLVDVLGITTIRNILCHPNRPFHESYWYAIAYLASSPISQKIGLEASRQALIDAEIGVVYTPPVEWLQRKAWRMPTNLPNEKDFDFGTTGLIGRESVSSEIKTELMRRRSNLFAIVAPGGTGKTALALHILNDITQSPEFLESFSDVLYFSAKVESLHGNGVMPIKNNMLSLEKISDSVNSYLETQYGSIEESANARLLVCVDNLETLIRDCPNGLRDFYNHSISDNWVLLLTSRVTVDNAYVFTLSDLDSKSAQHLVRKYSRLRGVPLRSEHEVTKVVEMTHSNPLAIKLTIEYLSLSGMSLPQAATSARQSTTEFAFKTIISSLSKSVLAVLECMFAVDTPTPRENVCTILGRSLDDISEDFIALKRTSLILVIYEQENEKFSLLPAARDYLVSNPVDIEIRREIQKSISRNAAHQQNINQKSPLSPLNIEYLPSSLDSSHLTRINDILKLLKARDRASWDKAMESAKLFSDIGTPIFRRLEGISRLKLFDTTGAIGCLTKAYQDGDIASGHRLAYIYRTSSDFKNAIDIAKHILYGISLDELVSEPYMARQAIQNYFLPLIFTGKYDIVIRETTDFDKHNELAAISRSLRAQALRERGQNAEPLTDKLKDFTSALNILSELYKNHGYRGHQSEEGWKLSSYLSRFLLDPSVSKYSAYINDIFIIFCSSHLPQIYSNCNKITCQQCLELVQQIKAINSTKETDVVGQVIDYWSALSNDIDRKHSISLPGMITVEICKLPRGSKSSGRDRLDYLFAKDRKGNDYYIRKQAISYSDEEWSRLSVGAILAVKHQESSSSNDDSGKKRARFVTSAVTL